MYFFGLAQVLGFGQIVLDRIQFFYIPRAFSGSDQVFSHTDDIFKVWRNIAESVVRIFGV